MTQNNYAKQLENVVFLKLKQSSSAVYYSLQNNKEIDFIAKNSIDTYEKYQVTMTLTDANKDRELSAFLNADLHCDKMPNILLTMDEKEEILQINGTTVVRKYLLKWLLDL